MSRTDHIALYYSVAKYGATELLRRLADGNLLDPHVREWAAKLGQPEGDVRRRVYELYDTMSSATLSNSESALDGKLVLTPLEPDFAGVDLAAFAAFIAWAHKTARIAFEVSFWHIDESVLPLRRPFKLNAPDDQLVRRRPPTPIRKRESGVGSL
jgi:hypothetical protein